MPETRPHHRRTTRLAAAAGAATLALTTGLLAAAPASGDTTSPTMYAVTDGGGGGLVVQIDSVSQSVTTLAGGFYSDLTALPGGDLLLFDFADAYRFDPVTATTTSLGSGPESINAAGTAPDGEVYVLSSDRIYRVTLAAGSYSLTQTGTLPSPYVSSGDLMVLAGGVYATVLDPTDSSVDHLLRMDDPTGANPTLVSPLAAQSWGLAETSAGDFVSEPNGIISSIDLATGARSNPWNPGVGTVRGLADVATVAPAPVVPEVPVAALLPLAAIAVAGAMVHRRRTA